MMKELSIEEKANAYDNVRNKIAARFGTNVAQEIFSEYEESDDERIRNTIIECLKGNMPDNGYRKECITWLEKQGERESDIRYKYLDELLTADDIYQMSMNEAMTNEAKTKAVNALSNLCISKLLGLEKQKGKDVLIKGFETEFERQISHLIASAINREHEYNEGYVKWTANALLNFAKHEIEKQGERESKKVPIWKHWKDGIAGGSEGEQIFLIKNGLHYSISSCLGYECDYIELSELDKLLSQEKQGYEPNWCHHKVDLSDCSEEYRKAYYDGWNNCNMQHEQCNAEHKLEPKFKVGDWITSDEGYINDDFRPCKIVGISDGCYTIQTINGYKGYNTFKMWENEYRLWSIADAKPGDVLANDNEIVIYKESNFNQKDLSGCMFVHCSLRDKNGYWYTIGGINPSNYIPATKEQRGILFQKMHEAGYTFDFESKELKKIESLTDFEKAFQGMCCEKNKQFAKECCKTLIELARKQLQSERNELELDETSYKVGVSRVLENPESYGLTKNYLKPSSSDIEALEDIMNGNSNPTSYLVLQSIIEQLKNT